MKKMMFYTTIALICSFFLNIRLAFYMFGDDTKLADGPALIIVNILTAIIGTVMLASIVFAFLESRKNDE